MLLLLLLSLAFVGVSVVLQTSLPRNIANGIATNLAGMDVRLGDLDIGWGGGVTISDLEVRLPGEAEEPGELVAEVPRLYAKLSPLPLLGLKVLTGGSPFPDRVEMDDPTLYMVESSDGVWTLPRALELLAATQSGGGSEGASSGGAISLPPLPELELAGGSVIIRNRDGEEQQITDLYANGDGVNALTYTFQAGATNLLEIDGRLTPQNGRTQKISVDLADELVDRLSPFIELPNVAARLDWTGAFTSDGGIEGVLEFDQGTQLTDIHATGEIAVSLSPDGTIEVEPQDGTAEDRLTLTHVPGIDGPVQVVAGTIRVSPDAAVVADLLVNVLDGKVVVDEAVVDLENLTATLRAGYQNLALAGDDSVVSGEVVGDLWYGRLGEPMATMTLVTSGEVAGQSFDEVSARVDVEGHDYRDFQTLDVFIGLPEGVLTRNAVGDELPFPPIKAVSRVRLDDEREDVDAAYVDLDLESVSGAGTLAAEGRFYLAQPDAEDPNKRPANYGLWFEANDWPVRLPRLGEPLPASAGFVFKGQIADDEVRPVEVASLYGRLGDIEVYGQGWYVLEPEASNPPLSLKLAVSRNEPYPDPPPVAEDAEEAFVRPGTDSAGDEMSAGDDTPLLAGDISAWFDIWGSVVDLDLMAAGEFAATGFAVGPYEIGDTRSGFDAELTNIGLIVDAEGSNLLDGELSFNANVPFDETEPGQIDINLTGLSLTRLSEAAALEVGEAPISGLVDLDLEATIRGFSPDSIRLGGTITGTNISTAYGTVADEMLLKPQFLGGQLLLPMTLRRLPPPGVARPEELGLAINPDEAQAPSWRELTLTAEYNLNVADEVVVRDLVADDYPLVPNPELLGDEVVGVSLLSIASEKLVIGFGGKGKKPGNDPAGGIESPLVAEGDVSASLDFLIGPTLGDVTTLLDVTVDVSASEQTVQINRLIGDLPGVGQLVGGGSLDLADTPGRSRIWIDSDIQLAPLAERLDLPEGGAGELDIALALQPAPGERPKGEILVDLSFLGHDARFRQAEIDRGQILAYLSRAQRIDGSSPTGAYDFTVLTTERIRLFVAGGTVEAYAKYRDRRIVGQNGKLTGDEFAQVTASGRGFDLSQIDNFLERDAEGEAAFTAELYGPLGSGDVPERTAIGVDGIGTDNTFARFTGRATVDVVDARLATLDLFRVILEAGNILRLPARDELTATIQFEAGDVFVTELQALIDGVEIRGNLNLKQLLSTGPVPLSGNVVLLAQPLRAFNLPFFAEAQEILDAIQANATAIRLGGTLDQPVAVPVLISDLGNTLGVLLGVKGSRGD